MIKINKLLTLILSCLMLIGFSACGEDDLSTNQYSGGVSLNVFGPSPVVRGGTLRFLGSNLDQIKEVIIPGIDPITAIDVRQAGVPSEILVQIPKDGPEEGLVTLVTASGEKIITKTELTYEETIEISGFSPASAMPGEVITIEGDYLNLIHEIIFSEDVAVPETEFISHGRYKIEVAVPEKARTGQIILSDGEETLPNWIYSEEELTVGTPTVEGITAVRFKAGETLTITGTYLNLVDYVKFVGIKIPSAALAASAAEEGGAGTPFFSVNAEGTSLTLVQPVEAASGTVELIARSGVEVPVATEEGFQVVVPTELSVAPTSVKAGASLTINGKDMDLVTSVIFPADVEGGEITVEATKLVVTAVPEAAVDGDVTLKMANGMSVTVPYTLVKPVVTAYSANPVNAGASLVLTGTDLDLVSSVSIGGEAATPDASSTPTALVISVPMDSKTGAVTLNLRNGTSGESPELTVNEAVFCYITEMPGEDVESKAGTVCEVKIANADKLTGVEVDGTSVQYIVNGDILFFNIPQSAGTSSKVKLISSNGEYEYDFSFAPAVDPETTIWTGSFDIGNWDGMQDLAWGAYDWYSVKPNQVLTFYFTENEWEGGYWQISLRHGTNWGNIPDCPVQTDLDAGATSYSIILTSGILGDLVTNGGLVITGREITLSKITIK